MSKKNKMPKDVEDDFKFILKSLELIAIEKENQGTIVCPKCNSNLNYTRASSNGHVWGKCKTENCLSWAT